MAKHYIIEIQKNARVQLDAIFKSGDKTSIKRINQIFIDLSEHPETGVGQPEKLRFDLSGLWSRQINKKDRLVYLIQEEIITVTIVAAKGHYGDK